MSLLEHLFKAKLNQKHRNKILYGIIATSFIGFSDALYLAVKHYKGDVPNCSFFGGCNLVAQSIYSEIFGVPVALIGVIGYLSIFFLALRYLDVFYDWILRLIVLFCFFAFTASCWFMYLQIFVIQKICLYCIVSATTSTILFVLGIALYFTSRVDENNNE